MLYRPLLHDVAKREVILRKTTSTSSRSHESSASKILLSNFIEEKDVRYVRPTFKSILVLSMYTHTLSRLSFLCWRPRTDIDFWPRNAQQVVSTHDVSASPRLGASRIFRVHQPSLEQKAPWRSPPRRAVLGWGLPPRLTCCFRPNMPTMYLYQQPKSRRH